MAEKNGSEVKMRDIYDNIWKTYTFLESTNESMVSTSVQDKIGVAITNAERAIEMVNILRLFSDNEELEEVATAELRYMLLSALLGYLTMKSTQQDRLDTVQKAQGYYKDYLRLCWVYGMSEAKIADLEEDEEEEEEGAKAEVSRPPVRRDQATLERERTAKVARYKQKRAVEARVQELYEQVNQPHVDDHTQREYFTALVKKWIHYSIEELESIKSEVEILQHMAKMKKQGKDPGPAENTQPKQPQRPFIITRDAVQKQVFGLGYPSVPTYSLDEFYDRQVALGQLPAPGQVPVSAPEPDEEDEARKKEDAVERDDPEALDKARQWDDWKDNHRRGWGNTYNRG